MILTQEEIKKISAVIGLIIGLVTLIGLGAKYVSTQTRLKIEVEQNRQQMQSINQKVDQILIETNKRLESIGDNFQKMRITDIEFKAEMKQKVSTSDGLLLEVKSDVNKIKDEMVNLKIVQHDLAKLEK